MMNMKTLKTSIFASAIVLAAVACTSQDDIYKEFVKGGGYIYPAKALNIKSETGFNKVTLFWPVPKDPSVRSARVYWDSRSDSVDLNYSDFTDTVSVKIEGLDDRGYTFEIVNFDKLGNRSMSSELTATPYGKNWLSTHEERKFTHAWVDGTTATVQLTESTSEMVATKFRYKNTEGEWVEYSPRMTPREVSFKLPDAKRGKYFEFCSGFLPSDGRDTVWMEWTKSSYPIVYPLDTKGWTVTATTGMTMGDNTPDKIFDGISDSNHRWHSTAGNTFPKILSIDTNCEPGKEPTYKTFSMARNPTTGYRYIFNFQIFTGNDPFNPDEKDFASAFGSPILSSLLYYGDNPGNRNCAMKSGRYLAIVFTNSRNKSGYIDLWELTVWGYIEAEAN